jgi:acetate kinase
VRILTLNAGSNSLKFEFVRMPGPGQGEGEGQREGQGSSQTGWGESVLAGSMDDVGKDTCRFTLTSNKQVLHSQKCAAGGYEEAARYLFDWIGRGEGTRYGAFARQDIDRVAHRVVHGADQFTQPAAITDEVIEQIVALEELAPLHNAPARQVIAVARAQLGATVPMFALFDTAFHRTLPDEAALYGLPLSLARRHRIRRYGFHGLSHEYLALRMAELLGRPLSELKLITLHLEGGSSAAAIRNGRSIDTSMGFTPLEGLMMGTRSGDLDPAIPLYLMRKEGWDAQETERFLNKQCGLLGVSGRSADTRELRQQLTDPHVDLALNIFCYRVRKYIGAYLATLGGADAIVLGGGIGENTAMARQRIACGMEWCGVVLDEVRNAQVIDREGRITVAHADLPVWVIPTQEGLMMAHHAARA